MKQNGFEWKAPKDSKVNGASIPPVLWSSIGSPFVGDYRRASVVHDVACDTRKQPHEAVHLMFYNAMRADGVGWIKANAMYQAVKRFGYELELEEETKIDFKIKAKQFVKIYGQVACMIPFSNPNWEMLY